MMRKVRNWQLVQIATYLCSVLLILVLLVKGELGLHLFWDLLIPLAPAIFVLIPGVWRNICPLSVQAQLPKLLGFATRVRFGSRVQAYIQMASLCLLLFFIPLRHLSLNHDAVVTAFVLLGFALMAYLGGSLSLGKSGWCNGLCPVQQVEKYYGHNPLLEVENAHCNACTFCVKKCNDSDNIVELSKKVGGKLETWSEFILVAGFPGFVLGWFLVPDFHLSIGFSEVLRAYGIPFLGLIASVGIYTYSNKVLNISKMKLRNLFALCALSIYYWFRIPALVGYGLFPGDGMLFDCTAYISYQQVLLAQVMVTLFWIYHFLFKNVSTRSWSLRPA
jgi:hypothetical protein